MADSTIITKISGDASGLVAALEQGKQAVSKFGDAAGNILEKKLGLKDLFKGLLQGVGIASVGAIAEKLVAPFKEAAESAQKIEDATSRAADATERLIKLRQTDNQQLATSIKQMERLQKEIETLSRAKPSKSYLGFIGRGSAADIMLGFSRREDAKRQEAIAQTTQKAQEKAVEVEEKKIEIRKKDEALAMKIAREDISNSEKLTEARKKLAAFEEEQRRKKLDSETQIALLEKDKAAVAADIAKYERFQREGGELTIDGTNELLELKTQQLELEGKIAEATKNKAKAEQDVTIEMRKQKDMREALMDFTTERTLLVGGRAFGKSRDPEEIKRASDEELRELIRRQKIDMRWVEDQKGQGPTALADAATNFLQQGTVIARLETDINRAMAELGLRNGLRRDFAFGGEDNARSRFQGDPLAFDRLFRQFVEDNRSTQKLLVQIDERLKGGIPTLTVDAIRGG